MRRCIFLLAGLTCAVALIAARAALAPPPQDMAVVVRVTHPPVDEMSGIVKSRAYGDVYWVHNDSGDEARLFAIRADGSVIMPRWLSQDYFVGAPEEGKKPYPGVRVDLAANSDWEDITIVGDTLYVADTGNNGNARRDLGLYVIREPNPEATERTRILKWLPIAYPDQAAFPGANWHFDCEAIFAYKGKIYFLTKHRANGDIDTPEDSASLYRLDTQYTDRVNVLKKIDSRASLGGWVTGADMSPDGRTLAVVCEAPSKCVWLFQSRDGSDRFLSGTARRLLIPDARQCEAICFADNDTLLVTNEQRDIFRLKVNQFLPAP